MPKPCPGGDADIARRHRGREHSLNLRRAVLVACVSAADGFPGLAIHGGGHLVALHPLIPVFTALSHNAANLHCCPQIHLHPLAPLVGHCAPCLRRVESRPGVTSSDPVLAPDAGIRPRVLGSIRGAARTARTSRPGHHRKLRMLIDLHNQPLALLAVSVDSYRRFTALQ